MIFNYSLAYKHNTNASIQQPVAVITNFSVDGRFVPIYFRYISDDSSESTIKIDGIKYTKDKHDGVSFCCVISNGSLQQLVMLSFNFLKCLWVLEG